MKRKKVEIKKKKEYTPFPPEQLLRKEDYAMMSGEYFLSKEQKEERARETKREKLEGKKQERIDKQLQLFEAPEEEP